MIENETVVIKTSFKTSPEKLWTAISTCNELRNWFIDLPEFKPEKGFKFTFKGGKDPENPYIHHCEVQAAIPSKLLTYSWRFENFPGDSLVSFEIIPVDEKNTKLHFSHHNILSFGTHPDFDIIEFEKGWNALINTSLATFLKD